MGETDGNNQWQTPIPLSLRAKSSGYMINAQCKRLLPVQPLWLESELGLVLLGNGVQQVLAHVNTADTKNGSGEGNRRQIT